MTAATVVVLVVGAAASAAGGAWKVQASPNAGRSANDNYLTDVAATSGREAWAVGYYNTPVRRTLIEHWNGRAWKIQKSPNRGGATRDNWLYGAAVTSSTSAWAVGHNNNGTAFQTLIEHWNGRAWKVQPSPRPGYGNALFGVAATSATNAWAVGHYGTNTLIEHWDGTAWSVQESPNAGGSNRPSHLVRVAAASPTSAWAVGHYYNGSADQTLIEHWDGTAWQIQKSPNPGGSNRLNELISVAATSPTNAWAVGYYNDGTALRTLIEHWNGTSWKIQQSPDPAGSTHPNRLRSVAAISATNAWAVGYDSPPSADRNLILHCC